ncbi:MAG: hypothetical protein LJE75_06075 [Gammaproteobacteria bacterium]|jgi:hypothetical protein|nr:hypothetical protein [Gammaproteobacteria bacterium]
MTIRRRQPGDRRWGFPVEYPLVDSCGFYVPVDRRRNVERRKAVTTLEEVEILLDQLYGNPPRNTP